MHSYKSCHGDGVYHWNRKVTKTVTNLSDI